MKSKPSVKAKSTKPAKTAKGKKAAAQGKKAKTTKVLKSSKVVKKTMPVKKLALKTTKVVKKIVSTKKTLAAKKTKTIKKTAPAKKILFAKKTTIIKKIASVIKKPSATTAASALSAAPEAPAAAIALKPQDSASHPMPTPVSVNTANIKDPELLTLIQVLEDKKAEQVVILDLENKSSIARYFVIATATGSAHMGALGDELHKVWKEKFGRQTRSEARKGSRWHVIDLGDILVHLFTEDERVHYNLEGLWGDAKKTKL